MVPPQFAAYAAFRGMMPISAISGAPGPAYSVQMQRICVFGRLLGNVFGQSAPLPRTNRQLSEGSSLYLTCFRHSITYFQLYYLYSIKSIAASFKTADFVSDAGCPGHIPVMLSMLLRALLQKAVMFSQCVHSIIYILYMRR